ncbi:MAG: amino acid adenylation domain-containing protein [Frankiaceae bacterium]
MTDHGRLCRSVAVRVRGLEPAGPPGRPWVEEIGTAGAERLRERELARPVDPRLGPGARAVLLRRPGAVAELVVVAHRAGSPAALDEMLGALDRIDAAPPPDWALGDPAAGAAVGREQVAVPGATPVTLLAALGLVLARYEGRELVAVGGPVPGAGTVLEASPRARVEDYLRSAAGPATRDPAAAPAAAGLAIAPGLELLAAAELPAELLAAELAAELLDARAWLAPLHPLSIELAIDRAGVARASCSYRHRQVDPAVARAFVRHLAAAHHALRGAEPGARLAELDPLGEQERRRIVALGGAGRPTGATPTTVHAAVAARAAETPDAVAVCDGARRITYRELDERAGRAAAALRAAGIGRHARIGVQLDRSADLVVLLLAVLRAGAAYVPLDPGYPADRLAYTARDAGLAAVIAASADGGPAEGVPVLVAGALLAAGPATGEPADGASPDDPAYVIYTSGSTGRPKGVVVPHRNVAHLMAATRDDVGAGPSDTWTFFHSPAFDFSVWEIWGCLTTGGRLVVVPYWVSRSPAELAELLATERVTVLSQTPSAFTQLMEVDRERPLPRLPRVVVLGGEPLDARPLLGWLDRHPETECRLVNMYGITETTVHVTAQVVTRREALAGSRSVGRALPGWSVQVRDPAGRLVPPGVAGEIHVGGAGVADGYLHRPGLTAERFLPAPEGGRLYRSGDRGRLLPDGRLEHLGRLDDQVKVRGHRIELNEIRSRLLDAPGVAAAVVVLREAVPGDRASARLDAYVVPAGAGGDVDLGRVRRHLSAFLPDYMLPSTVTPLVALPLTGNGKVDLARLPEPRTSDAALTDGPPADGAPVAGDGIERAVLAAWERLFGVRVRPDDTFFALGGNSLLAVRLAAALREQGLPTLALRDLYLNPTVPGLARVLAAAGEAR